MATAVPAEVVETERQALARPVQENRISLFEEIQARKALELLNIGGDPIRITLPDEAVMVGEKWISTPMDIAENISPELAVSCLVARVNGELWDMTRPLEHDCKLKLLKFDSKEGRDTFWHSSAHILGQALESEYACKLCIGPCSVRGEGFYYDVYYDDGTTLNDSHLRRIEARARQVAEANQPFERIVVSRDEAAKFFPTNKFKLEIISELPSDQAITIYRCGPLVDLCRGPHIPNTSFVKAFACLKVILLLLCTGAELAYNCWVQVSSSYWRGDASRESLQRVDGISFPDSKRLEGYKSMIKIKEEVKGVLEFIDYVYTIFGFQYELELSTRPEKYLGDIETWNKAEKQLKDALEEFGKPWEINEGDGAFYGPKIDVGVFDALKRTFQCVTFQLDFQLPVRFELTYSADDDAKLERPVIIHRAILGSIERMFAILVEHYNGKWPLWLSPRQAIVCSQTPLAVEYAKEVHGKMHDAGFDVDIDTTNKTIHKKVREAQIAQFNYILAEEADSRTVSVRKRDSAELPSSMKVDDAIAMFREEVASFSRSSAL